MDYGLALSLLSSGLIVEAKRTVMNSTRQHAETLRGTLTVPRRRAGVAKGE